MRKWKQLREAGRGQPTYHVRSQFLNGEYIHVVPLQNVKEPLLFYLSLAQVALGVVAAARTRGRTR